MNTTKLKELISEDASESVRRADEYTPYVYSHPKEYKTSSIYLFAAPKRDDLERMSTELAVMLARDAPVVLVNSCVHEGMMRKHLKRSGCDELPIKTVPLDDASLALRFDYLCSEIEACQAKALIINCFESAANTARHQTQLTQMLHQLRNKYDIAIFVYSSQPIARLLLCRNTRRGALGMLTFFAEEIEEAGDQLAIVVAPVRFRCHDLMDEHEKDMEENPPPLPVEDDPPLVEFNKKEIEQFIDEEDKQEDWFTEQTSAPSSADFQSATQVAQTFSLRPETQHSATPPRKK